ncbi:Inorganic pyrophosphatase 2 [Striga hermonthica]|uniref:Inorganic pyrophosphatase 2 n=1 Tax=Striga hermonthica TaxID=68872 RepID=A0A9N7MS72_STRHE|nr:Inorganic pyrophosphatase 2 [Striga hermonthica]
MADIVIVFDFDKTIIELDSDNWVVDELGATDLFNELLPKMPWNFLMGMVIEKMQASIANEGSKRRMIYLGDGAGDFCPSLKLRETDFMMPRKDFPVWELICENREALRAEVHEWVNGEDMEIILLELIEKIKNIQENDGFNSVQMLSVDCKLETVIPMAAYEASSVEYVVV